MTFNNIHYNNGYLDFAVVTMFGDPMAVFAELSGKSELLGLD